MKKIFMIGSTGYQHLMDQHAMVLIAQGENVRMPVFDSAPQLNELGIVSTNVENIRWADEVHIFWDARSTGTIFDFGACVALKKKVVICFLNKKTFANAMLQYADITKEGA